MEQGGENETFSSADLATLILVLLRDDQNFCKTIHTLEQESGIFFDMKYFENRVLAGDGDEVENYLSSFVKLNDNPQTKDLLEQIGKLRLLRKEHLNLTDTKNILLDFNKLIKGIPQLVEHLAFPEIDYPRLKILASRCLDRNMIDVGNALKPGTSGDVRKHSRGTTGLRHTIRSQVFSKDVLPTVFMFCIDHGSKVTSMDFHPLIATYLLVGTEGGDITLCSIVDGQRKAHQIFKIWSSSDKLLALKKDSSISVKKCIWNKDGSMVGVAFSKRLVELYNFTAREGLNHHLEIDAHSGVVYDISFLTGNKHAIATCGQDKMIKIWSLVDGTVQFICNNQAPILSICCKEDTELIWFADEQGNIKRWLYTYPDSIFQWNIAQLWPKVKSNERFYNMKLALIEDRLISCATGFGIGSRLAEWDVTTKKLIRNFADHLSWVSRSDKFIDFDIAEKELLVVGDFEVKFWAVDHSAFLLKSNLGMKLEFPLLKLNKTSFCLALSQSEKLTRILANHYGANMTKEAKAMQIVGGTIEAEKFLKFLKIDFKCLQLPDPSASCKVVRLLFASSGSFVVALLLDGHHKIWKWNQNNENLSAVATPHVVPQLWSPKPGEVMINETVGINREQAACCVLTKNNEYLASSSGGRISVFTLNSFSVFTLPGPPPVASCLAFHPDDNNVIAIGMDDSSIKIYDNKYEMCLATLKGHNNRISGLAFAKSLNLLVSAGADAQLCSWNTKSWMMEKSKLIQAGRVAPFNGETCIQFNKDESNLLVVLESLIAIYDGKLDCLHTWVPRDALPAPISSATFSCDGLMVYATYCDGSIAIFDSDGLKLSTYIVSSSYLPSDPSPSISPRHLYPTVVAAHPTEPSQIAFGMNNGAVYILLSGKRKRSLPPEKKSIRSASHFYDWLSQQNKPP